MTISIFDISVNKGHLWVDVLQINDRWLFHLGVTFKRRISIAIFWLKPYTYWVKNKPTTQTA